MPNERIFRGQIKKKKIRARRQLLSNIQWVDFVGGISDLVFSPALFCMFHFHFCLEEETSTQLLCAFLWQIRPLGCQCCMHPWSPVWVHSSRMTRGELLTAQEYLLKKSSSVSSAKCGYLFWILWKLYNWGCEEVLRGLSFNSAFCFSLSFVLLAVPVTVIERWLPWNACVQNAIFVQDASWSVWTLMGIRTWYIL